MLQTLWNLVFLSVHSIAKLSSLNALIILHREFFHAARYCMKFQIDIRSFDRHHEYATMAKDSQLKRECVHTV